jgi:hypothetical protein
VPLPCGLGGTKSDDWVVGTFTFHTGGAPGMMP